MKDKIDLVKGKVNETIKDIKEKGIEWVKLHKVEVWSAAVVTVIVLNILLSFIFGWVTTNWVNNQVRQLTNDSNSKNCIQMKKTIDNYESSDNENAKAFIEDWYKEAIKYVEQYCK